MTTAVLVLDMLTDFTSGKLANPAAAQITEPIAALTRAAASVTTGWSSTVTTLTVPATSSLPSSASMPWPAARELPSLTSWLRSPAM